ncbi:MAG TPA: aspartyl/asparaginyl beta-hydroxylase domain-containing protein [Alphaproteobacteria bacterium]|nr:aspartyl/asparaginyl beta-hydroxylase domain-containing protein [Alphaproteobacteria bacterium]
MGFWYDTTAAVIRDIYDSRIDGPPILDMDTYFPDGRRFSESWRAIRDEALAVAERLDLVPRFHDIMPEQTAISANDGRDWRMFILKAYGAEVPSNKALCPVLSAIVDSCPDVLSASFSFVASKKHIPPHRGPFRGVLRYYLGLSMPLADDGLPASRLTIAGETYRIGDGEAFLWDDTYAHEVLNRSNRLRVALLLDVKRHGMPLDMELFSKALIGIVRVGMRARGFA